MIPEHLIDIINKIPEKPGVYLMKDKGGHIMYVGKSKALRSRVRSYFNVDHKQEKINEMVSRIHHIDITVTDTHLEAQILECQLIKDLKPIYNRQLKNDRCYVYLRIGDDSRQRPLAVVNEREDGYCIGPYRSKSRLVRAVDMLGNTYPIIKCGMGYDFQYNILPRPLQAEDFERNRECLLEILSDDSCMRMFLSSIGQKMEEASLGLQYETAAIYRDLLGHVLYIKKGHPHNSNQFEDKEILMGEVIENGYKVFYISNSRIVLKRKYRRLSIKSLEAFINKARQLKDTQEPELDEKSQLDYKRIISTELKDTGTKAVSFADGRLDLDLFINRLREKGKA